jgi:hypothetical protein
MPSRGGFFWLRHLELSRLWFIFYDLLASENILEAKSTGIISIALASIAVIPFSGNALASRDGGATDAGEDRFGITQIYPTKDSGREWFVNMDDSEVGIFDPRTGIDQQPDWS